jgi:alpha-glucosidase
MYLPIERLAHYYGMHGEGVHLPSNMHLISVRYRARDIGALIDRYEGVLPPHAWPNWVLGNHDRNRVASRVGGAQARVAAILLLTLRGTPIVYYGDEIGMTDVPVPDELARDPFAHQVPGIGVGRDPERSPMRWTGEVNCGFCPPDVTPWLPIPDGERKVNVADQDRDPESMLTLYRSLIALRRAEPALAVGQYVPLPAADDDVLCYRREHEGRSLFVALNLGDQARTVSPDHDGEVLVSSLADRVGDVVTAASPVALRPDEGVVIGRRS